MSQTLIMEIPTPTPGTTVLIKGLLDAYGEGGLTVAVNNFTKILIPLTDEQLRVHDDDFFDADYWDKVIEVETIVDKNSNLEFKSIKLAE